MSDTPRRIRMDQWHPAEWEQYQTIKQEKDQPVEGEKSVSEEIHLPGVDNRRRFTYASRYRMEQWTSEERQEAMKFLQSLEPSPEEQEKWISVKDRLPELGNEYNVVWKPDAEEPSVTTMEYDAIEKKFIDRAGFCDSDCTDEVTHWQPLPSSPKTNPQT